MQSVGGTSSSRIVPRRAGSTASPPRAGIAASGTGRWVATSAMRASIVRSSSGGETSSSSIGCVPVGAASRAAPTTRLIIQEKSARRERVGVRAGALASVPSPRASRSFTVGARPIARDASRRPEVSARAAEGFGRVSTVDSPASSDSDAETDRDRDPLSPTVAPNGSDTNTRAETDATGAVVAPRARATASDVEPSAPMGSARRQRRERGEPRIRRWRAPPSNSTKSGWAELRRRELATTHPSSPSFASAIGDLAGLGFGGIWEIERRRAGGGGPAPTIAVVLVRFAARRSRDASNSSAIDAASTRCLSSSKFPRCRETTNGRRVTVGAVIGAWLCGDLERPGSCNSSTDRVGWARERRRTARSSKRTGAQGVYARRFCCWRRGRRAADAGQQDWRRSKRDHLRRGIGEVAQERRPSPRREMAGRDGNRVAPASASRSRACSSPSSTRARAAATLRPGVKDRVLRWEDSVVDARMAFDGVSNAEAWNAVAKAHAMSDDPLSCLSVLREMGMCAENRSSRASAYNIAVMGVTSADGRPDWARAMISRMRKIAARTGDPNMYPDAVTYTTAARAEAAAARGYTGAEHAGGTGRWRRYRRSSGSRWVRLRIRSVTAPSSTRSSRTAPSMRRSPRCTRRRTNRGWISPRTYIWG